MKPKRQRVVEGFWVMRLYPEKGSRLFVRAIVFERRSGMLAFAKGRHGPSGRDFAAYCSEVHVVNFRKGQPGRRSAAVACAVFYKSRLGGGLVSHEMFHATMYWARRRRIPVAPCSDGGTGRTLPRHHPEERLAIVQGELVRQFNVRCQDLGLW